MYARKLRFPVILATGPRGGRPGQGVAEGDERSELAVDAVARPRHSHASVMPNQPAAEALDLRLEGTGRMKAPLTERPF